MKPWRGWIPSALSLIHIYDEGRAGISHAVENALPDDARGIDGLGDGDDPQHHRPLGDHRLVGGEQPQHHLGQQAQQPARAGHQKHRHQQDQMCIRDRHDKPETEPKPRAPLAPMMTDHALGKAILGRAIADRPVEMKELTSDAGLVTVQGDIFKLETKELKGGEMLLLTFAVTDYTSSILCKIFLRYRNRFGRKREDDAPPEPITAEERKAVWDKVEQIKVGMNVKVRGECLYDNFAHELSISVRDVVPMERVERQDNAPEKRVELHMHTNMSTMDALTPARSEERRVGKEC